MTLQMRDPTTMESTYPFPRYYGTPEWLKSWHPGRWLLEQHHGDIRVEEYVEDGTLVVRAEIPDIDPDVDVALMLADGCMRIRVDRRVRHPQTDDRHTYRSEIRYGAFSRTLALPVDVKADGANATYADGILTISMPLADEPAGATEIPINRG